MKRWTVVLLCLLVVLAGCGSEKPASPQAIQDILFTMADNNDKLEMMTNPAEGYTVSVTEEFLSLLNLESWQPSEAEVAQTDIASMLYFDIPHSENASDFSRVAVFSNGYALIQLHINEGFGEMNWYACPSGTAYYTTLYDYVFSVV